MVKSSIEIREVIQLIGDKFILTNVYNKGAFLGMGSDMNGAFRLIFLLLLPSIVLIYVIYYIVKTKTIDRTSLIAFCCIVGGGIANVFDRIVFGKVTDFLFIDLGGVFKTGIFNVADISVTTGMLLLLFSGLVNAKKEHHKNLPE